MRAVVASTQGMSAPLAQHPVAHARRSCPLVMVIAATLRPSRRRCAGSEIRSGQIGRREAQQLYELSDNLIHQWLQQFDQIRDNDRLSNDDLHAACIEKIHALERKIGELVMALDACRGATTGRMEQSPEDASARRATPLWQKGTCRWQSVFASRAPSLSQTLNGISKAKHRRQCAGDRTMVPARVMTMVWTRTRCHHGDPGARGCAASRRAVG